ncbi:MAG: 1-(5-phosphoribosyl)-5-[(5-phosphoribosylamino)methylideneamino]imidazole-4-carboxamide isomerase [Tissierellaceae bacterium]
MVIYPAIDMKDRACVRLTQGSYDKVTVYESDPVKVAKRWEKEGASHIHLVDLDGARDGIRVNESIVKDILANIHIPVQLGGGIRDTDTIMDFLSYGVSQVIVGTAAIKNKPWIRDMIKEYEDKIMVSIDAKKGFIATDGWESISNTRAIDYIRELESYGLRRIVYTDIEKDGMLAGPNFKIYQELKEKSNIEIIASGGITTVEDLKRLKEIKVYGAIIGKALYGGELSLQEALKWQ